MLRDKLSVTLINAPFKLIQYILCYFIQRWCLSLHFAGVRVFMEVIFKSEDPKPTAKRHSKHEMLNDFTH